MNHPRYSVLNLFDPLTGPSTPRRELPSPDSDKENVVPDVQSTDQLTMSAFFNRTYAVQKSQPPTAVPKGRLVDIGDMTVTVEDAELLLRELSLSSNSTGPTESLMAAVNELEGDDSDDENFTPQISRRKIDDSDATPLPHHVARTPPRHIQRTPLADISLDATPVPSKAKKAMSSESVSSHHSSTPLKGGGQADSHDSSCASSVNAFNIAKQELHTCKPAGVILSGPSCSQSPRRLLEPSSVEQGSGSSLAMSFAQESPLSPQVNDPALSSSTALLIPSPTRALLTNTVLTISPPSPPPQLPLPPATRITPFAGRAVFPLDDASSPSPRARLRPRSNTTTSALDPRRTSVDLHTSFNWQLQCPEASFDLLNDRISFLGGQESFLKGLDDMDEFNMEAEEEMMEALAKKENEENENENAQKCLIKNNSSTKASEAISSTNVMASRIIGSTPIVTPTHVSANASLKSTPRASQSIKKRFSLPSSSPIPHFPTFAPDRAVPKSLDPSQIALPGANVELDNESLYPLPSTADFHESSLSQSSTEKQTETQPQFKTPPKQIYPAAKPIHALRIVKRNIKHARDGSTSSTGTNGSAGSNECANGNGTDNSSVNDQLLLTAPPLSVASQPQKEVQFQSQAQVQPTIRNKPVLNGVQRPPPGVTMPSKPIPGAPAAYGLGFSAEKSGIPSSGSEETKMSVKSRLTGPAPMGLRGKEEGKGKEKSAPAILSSIKSRLQKPASSHINIGSNPSAGSTTSSEISRPAQSRLPSSISGTSTSSLASGIRPPSRYTSNTVGSKSGSSLPRPVSGSMSRLPAPAPGGVRSKLAKAGTFGFGSGASTLGRAAGRNV